MAWSAVIRATNYININLLSIYERSLMRPPSSDLNIIWRVMQACAPLLRAEKVDPRLLSQRLLITGVASGKEGGGPELSIYWHLASTFSSCPYYLMLLWSRAWSVSSCATWTATARRTCTWAARWRRRARRSRGHRSAHGAATTACCPGLRATNGTAGLRTVRATSASWSSSASASWQRRSRSGGSRPTKVWRV